MFPHTLLTEPAFIIEHGYVIYITSILEKIITNCQIMIAINSPTTLQQQTTITLHFRISFVVMAGIVILHYKWPTFVEAGGHANCSYKEIVVMAQYSAMTTTAYSGGLMSDPPLWLSGCHRFGAYLVQCTWLNRILRIQDNRSITSSKNIH